MNQPVTIAVTQRYRAQPARLYASWLDSATLGSWMFEATMQDEVLQIAIDPRIGGRFSFRVRRGDQQIDHVGEYLELAPPHRIVFTWGIAGTGASSRVAIDIEPDGDGARATLTATIPAEWASHADRTQAGWRKILAAQADAIR